MFCIKLKIYQMFNKAIFRNNFYFHPPKTRSVKNLYYISVSFLCVSIFYKLGIILDMPFFHQFLMLNHIS